MVATVRRKTNIEMARARRERQKKKQLRPSLARIFKIRQKRKQKSQIKLKPYEIRRQGRRKFLKKPISVRVSNRIRSKPYWHTQRRSIKVVYLIIWVYEDEFRGTVNEGVPFYITMNMRTSETRAYELARKHIPYVEQLFSERNPKAIVLNILIDSITVGKRQHQPYKIPEAFNRRELKKRFREMT